MVIQPSASFSYWTVGERKKNMPALIRESCSSKIRGLNETGNYNFLTSTWRRGYYCTSTG